MELKVWQLISNNFAERALVKDFLRGGGGGERGKGVVNFWGEVSGGLRDSNYKFTSQILFDLLFMSREKISCAKKLGQVSIKVIKINYCSF